MIYANKHNAEIDIYIYTMNLLLSACVQGQQHFMLEHILFHLIYEALVPYVTWAGHVLDAKDMDCLGTESNTCS